jgi:hypothetical protein
MKKVVDGKTVAMTSDEIAELRSYTPIEIAPVTVVYSVDFWTRLDGGADGNSGEVAQVLAAMEQQPIRIRKIFETANSYRSDHEMWPLLVQIATTLFGADRAAEILAPSIP